jgi:hypothetical protein
VNNYPKTAKVGLAVWVAPCAVPFVPLSADSGFAPERALSADSAASPEISFPQQGLCSQAGAPQPLRDRL